MDVKTIISDKGKLFLVLNNAKFCKARVLSNGEIRWLCVTKLCTAKIYTKGNYSSFYIYFTSLVTCDIQCLRSK